MALDPAAALRVLCALLSAGSIASFAQTAGDGTIQARVVAYASASAFAVLDPDEKLKRVKLSGVDAPETRQPFGEQAQRLAADYLGRQSVAIAVDRIDGSQRIHGRVAVDGTDVGLVLLQAGLSWCDPSDSEALPAALRTAYGQACEQARAQRRGLWQQANPVPPWQFRKLPQFEPPRQPISEDRRCEAVGHNSLQCDDGSRYREVGREVIGSDGTRYSRRGRTVTGTDGERYERQGKSIYGSDGSVCRERGRQIYCY